MNIHLSRSRLLLFPLDNLITNENHEKTNVFFFEKLKFSFVYPNICNNTTVISFSSKMCLGSKWFGIIQNNKKIKRICSYSKDLSCFGLPNEIQTPRELHNQITFTSGIYISLKMLDKSLIIKNYWKLK